MLYDSETWCLREKKWVSSEEQKEQWWEQCVCGAKLADRKNTEDMIDMLGLNQTIDEMTKGSGVR